MFEIINYPAFLLACILLNLTPGIDTFYILGKSITGGLRSGLISALGINSGLIIHTVLVAFGLTLIIVSSPLLFWAIKILGCCYLALMGIHAIVSKKKVLSSEQPDKNKQDARQSGFERKLKVTNKSKYLIIFLQGVLTNISNPKIALFFLAFLPQFVRFGSLDYSPLPFLLLGASFICTSTIWCCILAACSGQLHRLFAKKPVLQANAGRVTGVVYILLGLSIFATPLPE